MKKILLALVLTVAFACVGLYGGQRTAEAATPWQIDFWNNFCAHGSYGTGCRGYFTGITPGCIPNGCWNYDVLSGGLNVSGTATGCGSGTACEQFINTVRTNLYSRPTPYQDNCGAAFIVNTMLGHAPFGSNCAAGIAAARGPGDATFSSWVALVQSYSRSTDSNYGVLWNTMQNPDSNSAWYDNNPSYPNNIMDDVSAANVWHCNSAGCGGRYRDDETTGWRWARVDVPIRVIMFYFPGGSFMIERGCANLVGTMQPLPIINQEPTGTVTLRCDLALQRQVATINFRDSDAATTAYITAGSWTSGTGGTSPATITIPQSATDPYAARPVRLYVRDTGRGGSFAYVLVSTVNTVVPCVAFTCGNLTVTPMPLDPYMRFSAAVSVANGVNAPPPGATIQLRITPPAGATYSYNSAPQAAGGGGGVSSATFSGLGPTNNTGVFTATWTLAAPGGTNQACLGTIRVVNLPYMHVYGGDVSVGSAASENNGAHICTTNTEAGIYGWNNHTGGFSGAGSQYAVQALAQIRDFASAVGGTNTPPIGLSFANEYSPADATRINPSQGLFGGYSSAAGSDCDFTRDITTPPVTTPLTIGATTIAQGTQVVRYVRDADVYITGNIVYQNAGGWAGSSNVPYFKLVVVGGHIYIGRGVTQLDGLYVAEQATDGSGSQRGGVIFTCANGMGDWVDLNSPGEYGACNQRLTVNGAFVAQEVRFTRTNGSVGQATGDTYASNRAAEIFNYSPELWLPRGGMRISGQYAAIAELPPVL